MIQQIGDRAEAFLSSWKNAQATRPCNNNNITPHETVRWTKLSVGRFKCNVDASFSTPLNKVGLEPAEEMLMEILWHAELLGSPL
jgi:hypothetical protein